MLKTFLFIAFWLIGLTFVFRSDHWEDDSETAATRWPVRWSFPLHSFSFQYPVDPLYPVYPNWYSFPNWPRPKSKIPEKNPCFLIPSRWFLLYNKAVRARVHHRPANGAAVQARVHHLQASGAAVQDRVHHLQQTGGAAVWRTRGRAGARESVCQTGDPAHQQVGVPRGSAGQARASGGEAGQAGEQAQAAQAGAG